MTHFENTDYPGQVAFLNECSYYFKDYEDPNIFVIISSNYQQYRRDGGTCGAYATWFGYWFYLCYTVGAGRDPAKLNEIIKMTPPPIWGNAISEWYYMVSLMIINREVIIPDGIMNYVKEEMRDPLYQKPWFEAPPPEPKPKPKKRMRAKDIEKEDKRKKSRVIGVDGKDPDDEDFFEYLLQHQLGPWATTAQNAHKSTYDADSDSGKDDGDLPLP